MAGVFPDSGARGDLVEKDCLNAPIIWEQNEFHKNFFSLCVTILKMI